MYRKSGISRKWVAAFFWASVILFSSSVSFAGTYYVSPDGTVNWADCGTPAKSGAAACSWQTAMANAVADDVVYFKGGAYNLGTFANHSSLNYAKMYPANSGASGHPITFKAYPGETPVLTGTVVATSQEAWFGCGNGAAERRSYITWDGFAATIIVNKVDPAQHYETTIFRTGGDYCTIKNCNFTGVDNGDWQFNTSFIRVEASDHAVVENNYLHDLTGTGVNTTGIWLFDSTNTAVRNNTIQNCRGGIYAKMYPQTASYYYNFIYNGSDACYRGVWFNCSGGTNQCQGNAAFQNIIVGCNQSLNIGASGVVSGTLMYNNTVYHGAGSDGGIHITETNGSGYEIFNNVISYRFPYVRLDMDQVAVLDYNIYFNAGADYWWNDWTTQYTGLPAWTASTGYDAHSYVEDPLFANPGGSNPADYKISSAHKDSGRGGAYPSVIGAYITGNEIIGYLPLTDSSGGDTGIGPKQQRTLTVSTIGAGTGRVTSSPAGIDCGSDCSETCDVGTEVEVMATPDAGMVLADWSVPGCPNTSNTCKVKIERDTEVSVTFASNKSKKYQLKVIVQKGGVVSTDDLNINCSGISKAARCTGAEKYYKDAVTVVTLTAEAANGYIFTGWTGCTTTNGNTCSLTMKKNLAVTAKFRALKKYSLRVVAGKGGTVASDDGNIACNATGKAKSCAGAAKYTEGNDTAVTLTASPSAGYAFKGWSGGGCSGTDICTVAMSANRTVEARFRK